MKTPYRTPPPPDTWEYIWAARQRLVSHCRIVRRWHLVAPWLLFVAVVIGVGVLLATC